MATKNTRSKKKNESRSSLELTPRRTASLAAFALLAIVWAFILGVFVGRGYNPEDVLPDLTRIIPEAEEQTETVRILRPEELEFYDRLRLPPSSTVQAPTLEPEKTPVQPVQEQEAPVTAPLPPAPEKETFVYTYQVGSFQNMERAGRLQQQLHMEGFSATITKFFVQGEPWYRVLIEVETSPSEIEQVKQKLSEHGITQPLLRGKRPS